MIARAPRDAGVIGIVLLTAGPDTSTVRWTGWAEVWVAADGKRRAAFPPMSSIRDARGPRSRDRSINRMLNIKIKKETFIPWTG